MTDPKNPDQGNVEDDWAAAMAEQEASETAADKGSEPKDAGASKSKPAKKTAASSAKAAKNAGEEVFKPLEGDKAAKGIRDLDMILEIPVKLNVELGRTKLTIKQLLELSQGSVVELEGLAGDPMDILINGYLVAQGEVVVVDDKYGIRITEIITPSERVQKLNR